MEDDRLRQPIGDDYKQALGCVSFVFCVLEWNAVWCCERLQPGYIKNLSKKTAGTIANNLVNLVRSHSDPKIRAACSNAAEQFQALVAERNTIVHAKPCTTPSGLAGLSANSEILTVDMINDSADRFAACSHILNGFLYSILK